jgi:hypothetical protein
MLVLVLLMPVHMLLLACEALFLSITGTGFTKIRRIYGGIPIAIWKHRRNIRALRKRLMHQRHDALRSLFAFTSWFPHKLRMLARHGRPHVQ